MKRGKTRFWWVLVPLLLLMMFWAFAFGQKSSNSEAKMVKIGREWSEEQFDRYWKDSFGLSIPFGLSTWVTQFGYRIQPCRFSLSAESNVYDVIQRLREFRNQTIDITIVPGIYINRLSRVLKLYFDISEEETKQQINNNKTWESYGFDNRTWPTLIVPNTYNFSINTKFEQFIQRMERESRQFWTESRIEKLKSQKLSRTEAVTIASIVQKESNKTDEYEKIAGVYINRLRIGMKLMADPTLVFIRGHGGRVYNKDKELASPYNTYKNKGLPPGPICIPSIAAIDAVLNYTEHRYLYFCAKSDFSGYHVFERHYRNHRKNARAFHRALNNLHKRQSKTNKKRASK